jgi:hypothetical protein
MSPALEAPQKYVLGLDLGSASLGWAMIALNPADEPTSLIRAGVRIFEPGVDGTPPDFTAVSFAAVLHVSGSFFKNFRRLDCSQPMPLVLEQVQSSGTNS